MIPLLTWAMVVVGVVYVTSTSTIFALPRMLIAKIGPLAKALAYCPACQAHWVGLALYFWTPINPWYLSGVVAMGLVAVLKAFGVFNNDAAYEAEQGDQK